MSDLAPLFSLALEEFHDLDYGDDAYSEAEGHNVLDEVDRREAEGVGEEGDFTDQCGGKEAAKGGPVEGLVHALEREEAAALRAHVEAVADLGHAHGEEGHGRAVGAVGYLPDAGLDEVADKVAREGQQGDDDALIGDVRAHAAGEDAGGRLGFFVLLWRTGDRKDGALPWGRPF